jgi:hypothetical protein
MTTVSICCTISLEAHEVYRRYSKRRDGSSMVNDAILFFDEHGPSSKTSLTGIVHQREQSIAFLQDYILKLNDDLSKMKSAEDRGDSIAFDAASGSFRFTD